MAPSGYKALPNKGEGKEKITILTNDPQEAGILRKIAGICNFF
jgi:hypothetical protein